MPFLVELRLPEFDEKSATIVDRFVPVGVYVDWGEPVALLGIGDTDRRFVCNMPVVIEAWHVGPGDTLVAGTLFASAQAEGDEIPYGKPMVRIEAS